MRFSKNTTPIYGVFVILNPGSVTWAWSLDPESDRLTSSESLVYSVKADVYSAVMVPSSRCTAVYCRRAVRSVWVYLVGFVDTFVTRCRSVESLKDIYGVDLLGYRMNAGGYVNDRVV